MDCNVHRLLLLLLLLLLSLSLSLLLLLRCYLNENVAAPVKKTKLTAVGIRRADHATPSIRKSWHELRQQTAVARSV
jgi:hypothetical protein